MPLGATVLMGVPLNTLWFVQTGGGCVSERTKQPREEQPRPVDVHRFRLRLRTPRDVQRGAGTIIRSGGRRSGIEGRRRAMGSTARRLRRQLRGNGDTICLEPVEHRGKGQFRDV